MRIGELMEESGVRFGTSGARGLVSQMTDRVCYAYTQGFLEYAAAGGAIQRGGSVALAGDYRPSTDRILAACVQAIEDLGYQPRYLGRIPTPALAYFGIQKGIPSLMVTGSHIPDDRNGIKFNLPWGEILKSDEAGIRQRRVRLPAGKFREEGSFLTQPQLPAIDPLGLSHYVARYQDFFPADCLQGLRIGLYEHSSVAREAFFQVLSSLGAAVERLGRSETFVPVDTEAIRQEDIDLARTWARQGNFDALVSADGDGDRPLIADEQGRWLRGDIAGILCARQLGAQGVAVPISCNTALEKTGWFPQILRTRIGSPYVIEGMNNLCRQGVAPVVGYEANGGFLTATAIQRAGHCLSPLPTRDAVLVAVTLLQAMREQGRPLSALVSELPKRFTASDRIQNFPTELSRERLAVLNSGDPEKDRAAAEALLGDLFGSVEKIDHTDGVRLYFTTGEIVHLRPSGNAPELRVYTEADTQERAWEMNRRCLEKLAAWL